MEGDKDHRDSRPLADLEEVEGVDVLDGFTDEIRGLEARITDLERERQELLDGREQLIHRFEILVASLSGKTNWTSLSALISKIDEIDLAGLDPELGLSLFPALDETYNRSLDLEEVVGEVGEEQNRQRRVLSSLQRSQTEGGEPAAIKSTWRPGTVLNRKARVIYLELIKKKKERHPAGWVRVLSSMEISNILSPSYLDGDRHDLVTDNREGVRRVRKRVVNLARVDGPFHFCVGERRMRRRAVDGKMRSQMCLVHEVGE